MLQLQITMLLNVTFGTIIVLLLLLLELDLTTDY